MPCILPDGQLTESAEKILGAAREASLPEEIAKASGIPLFRVRSSLRELIEAGLIEERDGKYGITSLGEEKSKG